MKRAFCVAARLHIKPAQARLTLAAFALSLATSSLSAAMHFVSESSANPTTPYSTWATAATNIQQAVDVTAAGDVVLVTNGHYSGSVTVTNPLWLLSVAFPQQRAVIDGHGTNRCVWIADGVRLDGFTITNGQAQIGGGVYCGSTSAYVTNCLMVSNSATVEGGGVYGGTIGRSTLSGNSAGSGGGAAYASLEACILSSNSCNANGGGTLQSSLDNCLLTDNTGNSGGGAFGGTLNNCTLSGNQATVGGGAGSAVLNNTVVYFNTASTGTNVDSCTLNYCCTSPLPGTGAGNIGSNPSFVDLAGGNLRLQSISPCVNAGNNSMVVNPTGLDLDRNARVIGGNVDMGAYELTSLNSPVLTVQPQSQTVYSGTDITFTASADGSTPLIWQWRFNGVPISGATIPTLTRSAVTTNQAGGYSVVVTNSFGSATSQVAVLSVVDAAPYFTRQPVSQSVALSNYTTLIAEASGSVPIFWQWQFNGAAIQDATNSSLIVGPVTSDLTGGYTAVARNAFGSVTSAVATVSLGISGVGYVWQNSPSPTPPYTNWTTAAHTIQDAADAAGAWWQIVVTNGVYAGAVNIVKPLMLMSVNGPQATVIDAGYALISCVSLTNGASLTGFTVTHGYGYYGGGVSCVSTNAFVTNCVITGNRAQQTGGGAYGGTFYNCTLTANTATNWSGGAYGSTLINCTVSTNIAGSAYFCTLINCKILGNTQYGGGVLNSILYNCSLIGNGTTYFYDAGANSSTLYNCTLIGNIFGARNSTLYNCIVYNSTAGSGTNFDQNSSLNYCCTTPFPPQGIGNITNAPIFVDSAGGDFHMQSNSPCINAGNNTYVSTATDLDGNPRIVSGTVDIGAFEYQGLGSVISYAWLQQCGFPTDGSVDFVDSDGDGMNNWQEWVAGTDPNNKLSVFRMISASHNSAGVAVSWQSVSNRTYFLQRGGSFVGKAAFLTLATNIVGLAGTTSYSDTNTTGTGAVFYRVGVQEP
jgi:hypothetical protein